MYSELIKEDDLVNNLTKEYTYDNYGNILSKKTYTYNTNNLIKEDAYTYGNSNWQDLLTKFNNDTITYDNIGNPKTIGTKKLTWMNGRELASYKDSSNTITYKYNLDGIRTTKTINGNVTKYYLEGSSIIFEDRNGSMIYYFYNGNELLGFIYNDKTYYYHKNIFGDIIGILNTAYKEIVTYEYDSWGAITNITDNSGINLSEINPFRYRSYYYDAETGLYYLNSRYYNPEWGRFVNADDNLGSEENVLSYNNFQYSFNNPANMLDDNGEWPKWAKDVLIGATVITTCAVASAMIPGVGGVIAGAALSGALSGAGIGAATGAAVSGISHAANNGFSGVGSAILEGASSGFASGAIGGAIVGGGTASFNIISGNTNIIGSAHGTLAHKSLSNISAGNMASSGSYDTVYLNKGLKSAGLNTVNGKNLRPDVMGTSSKVSSKVVEVVSAKQSITQVVNKVEKIKTSNSGVVGKTVSLLRKVTKWLFGK